MQGYPVMVGYPMVAPAYQGGYPGNMMISGAGSIRSVQSVPMLAPPSHTWDGEPCPVHHQHQHHHQQAMPLAALYGGYKHFLIQLCGLLYTLWCFTIFS